MAPKTTCRSTIRILNGPLKPFAGICFMEGGYDPTAPFECKSLRACRKNFRPGWLPCDLPHTHHTGRSPSMATTTLTGWKLHIRGVVIGIVHACALEQGSWNRRN